MNSFVVISLTIEDIARAGYNANDLTDEEMQEIADSIGSGYAEKDFERDIMLAAVEFNLVKK